MIQIFQIEIDIIKYKVDQTGANTQLGGLKLGRIISEYQGSLKKAVVNPPIADAVKVIKSIKSIKIKSGDTDLATVTPGDNCR